MSSQKRYRPPYLEVSAPRTVLLLYHLPNMIQEEQPRGKALTTTNIGALYSAECIFRTFHRKMVFSIEYLAKLINFLDKNMLA
ncbi:MAG: hypothetical protein AUJ12_09050 [Alphaproteobacteria bacterium CG1_02_46_17]|nr:MAG: hypothetical protein AUJ12_09050 [Alphaproteobacteria bacterium CG1_02_46_17]